MIDLGTWADGGYQIAAENTEAFSDENPESEDHEK